MKRTVLFGGATVVVLLVAVLAVLFRPTGGTAVEKKEAVKDFRNSERSSGQSQEDHRSPAATDRSAGRSIPSPGVYTYAAEGQEVVKVGPLPADTRVFPDEVMASVVAADRQSASPGSGDSGAAGACFDFQLSLIAEHVETTRYCRDGDGLTIDRHDKTLKVGPMTATATVSCEPKLVIRPSTPDDSKACKLSLSGGPVKVETAFDGSTQIGEVTRVEVQGSSVDALPVTVTYLASGSVTGTWTERFWMSVDDWLPVRIERDIALTGPMSITDKSRMDLLALDPAV